MAIRTCFFDMGNVLVHFSHEQMCRNIADVCGWTVPAVRQFFIDDGRQWKLERGELSEADLHTEICQVSERHIELDQLRHAAGNIFRLNDSIVPVLQQLRTQGIRLVLLSNTSVTHLRFIEQNFQVLDLLHARIASFEVGAMKPEDAIFQAALRVANCEPHECFYTDDIVDYVNKAATFGIVSRVFTNTESLIPELCALGLPVRGSTT